MESINKPDPADDLLTIQEFNYLEWAKEDQFYIQKPSYRAEFTENAKFTVSLFEEAGIYEYYVKFHEGSYCLSPSSSEPGIELSSLVFSIPYTLSIRSLAVQANFQVRLSFHSTFYIFLRVLNKPNELTPVIKLIKDTNLRGIFLVFGKIDPATLRFQYLKQEQLPEERINTEYFRDLDVQILDNGDNSVYVTVKNIYENKAYKMGYSGFTPQLQNCQIWVAGSGDNVFIKEIEVKHRQRKIIKNKYKRIECVCSVF